MTLRRLPDWPVRLSRFLAETRHEPFAWSTMDCAAWPLRGIDAMCGTALADELRDQYHDEESSQAYCNGRGWLTLADAAIGIGCTPLALPAKAQRGDLLYFAPGVRPNEHAHFVGVLALQIDGHVYVTTKAHGLVPWTLAAIVRAGAGAFAVGR